MRSGHRRQSVSTPLGVIQQRRARLRMRTLPDRRYTVHELGAGSNPSSERPAPRTSSLSASEYHFTATTVRVRAFVIGLRDTEDFDGPRDESTAYSPKLVEVCVFSEVPC